MTLEDKIDFLYINRDFFIASITSQAFQMWATTVISRITPLSNDLHNALDYDKKYNRKDKNRQVAELRMALCGNANGSQGSLLEGCREPIAVILSENIKLGRVLEKHANNTIIDEWYKSVGKYETQEKIDPIVTRVNRELRNNEVRAKKQATIDAQVEKAKAQAKIRAEAVAKQAKAEANVKTPAQTYVNQTANGLLNTYYRDAFKNYLTDLYAQKKLEPEFLSDKTTENPIYTLLKN